MIRVGLEGIPPFTAASARFAIACATLMAVVVARRIPLGRTRRERRLWLVNGLGSYAIAYGLVYWAEQTISSGLAAVLFATFTLFVAVMAHFMIPGERLTASGALGVLVGFAGVAVIFSDDLGGTTGGREVFVGGLMLFSPLAAAFANVAIKRWGSDIHPLSISAVPMGLTAGVLGALALVTERERPIELGAAVVGSVLYLALVGTALAFALYFWLLSRVSATRLALLTYISPVVAVAIGAAFLGETVTARMVVGSLAVLAGVVLAAKTRRTPVAAAEGGDRAAG